MKILNLPCVALNLALSTFISLNAQWSDDFSDGDITNNPQWVGDTTSFIVNASGQLQLNASASGNNAQLAVESYVTGNAEWTFNVNMEFNPSQGNYANIYVMSDTYNFNGDVSGYFVRVGYTNDNICLLRQTGNASKTLIDGRDKMLNASYINVSIKVTKDNYGNWQLFCDTTGNKNYQLLGTAFDNSIINSQYFGIHCYYSSTRANKFFFDDFNVTTFTGMGDSTFVTTPFLYDIVFNEVMSDPTPSILLPDAEYVEIYNRSTKDFYTNKWTLKAGTTSFTLPDTILKSKTYMVFNSKKTTSLFTKWCNPVGIFGSSSVLTNSGQHLELHDKNGNLVSWLEYSDTWFADEYKKDGGWSLEQIDPENPCGGRNNWKASVNKSGGTPGFINSVCEYNPDITSPFLKRVQIVNDSMVRLLFNEPLSIQSADKNNYIINNSNLKTESASFYENNFSVINLEVSPSLRYRDTCILTLTENISDCVANPIQPSTETTLTLPQETDSSDIIINEVLFNSKPFCPDYVELYNRTSKYLGISELLMVVQNGNTEKTYRLASENFLFYPGSYIVVTQDPGKLSEFFSLKDLNAILEIPEMTSLDDDAGSIILKTTGENVIDIFSYKKEMHMPVLVNTEGVSLERVSPEKAAHFPDNWHSCSETAGYGTPGYQNSQYITNSEGKGTVFTENELFSPDNDGYNDVFSVRYDLKSTGARISAWIFDLEGRKIRELANNVSIEPKGTLNWDGVSDYGRLSNTGIYVAFIRVVNSDGSCKEYKLPCVITRK